ncbi:MAG: putative glycolipid-binding domain-containing protein [Pseudomonadota bacterium]|nr:putative glycolipid-binding domain-containing protein [Pseudomonadota bacterium]
MIGRPQTAFWRTLFTPGHDTALLVPALTGWHLTGMTAFLGEGGPVAVNYTVEVDDAWQAKRGSIRGIAGGRRFFHSMERKEDGWTLDATPNGLADLTDLDFGFTPATNLLQLKRAALEEGERAEFSVVWFDIGRKELVDLPQIYERRDEKHYWYESPTDGYEAMLEMDESGFVRVYPELWAMEEEPAMPDELSDEELSSALASSEE